MPPAIYYSGAGTDSLMFCSRYTPSIGSSRGSHRSFRLTTVASAAKSSRWSLRGSTALVTGGTRGIGHAIVEELGFLFAKVHTCARNKDELEKSLRDWEEQGREVSGSVCNVSSAAGRERLIDNVSSVLNGKLNILEFTLLIGTNFGSSFHICQLVHALLKASSAGSIVFTSSVSGFVSLKNMSVHGASKGAINQLTKNLACEWARDIIRVNAITPWYIRTSMVEQVLSNKEYLEECTIGLQCDGLEIHQKCHRWSRSFVCLHRRLSPAR